MFSDYFLFLLFLHFLHLHKLIFMYSGEAMKLIGDRETPALLATPEFNSMTVRWPVKSKIPVILGRWIHLPDDRIEAIYTASELAVCLMVAAIISEQESVE